jgi:glucose-6-phosphate isomerase
VLSLVGLLPALYLGLDVGGVRAGASAVLAAARAATAATAHPAAEGAALSLALYDGCGIGSAVMLIYCDALLPFGRWYQQLLAESLGKNGKGLTPLIARGVTDQHSALQLYLAGPADKFFTVLGPVARSGGVPLDRALASSLGIAYLGGRTLDELFAAEASATAAALVEARRPVRRIALPALDAQTLGALFMHFMLETVLMAKLLGINAYDQPAVEHGKLLARQLLEKGVP